MNLGIPSSAATAVGRFRIVAFVVSFVPGGTFGLEARLRQDEREPKRQAA